MDRFAQLKLNLWEFKGKVEYLDKWFLMGSPYPLLIIFVAYLMFVLKLGPEYMKNRAPLQLKRTMIIYNITQVVVSTYLCFLGSRHLWQQGLFFPSCMDNDEALVKMIIHGGYIYALNKIIELLDTVFFVLRKKQNQITFLHVYHHSIMVLMSWIVLKYEPNEDLAFAVAINSFVHIVMYGYYCLSVIPGLEKYLWWKKYITKLQLLQFLMMIIHITVSTWISECPVGRILLITYYFNVFLFIYLFREFYITSYSNKKKAQSEIVHNNNIQSEINSSKNERNVSVKKKTK